MRTRSVVIGDVFVENLAEMGFAEDKEFVQTLMPNCPHPSLSIRVGVWRTKRCANDVSMGGLENRIEGGHELGVSVMDQEMDAGLTVFQLPNHLAGLLSDSRGVRMGRAASQIHAPRLKLDKEQHIYGLQEERVDREEIASEKLCLVMLHQLPPTGRLAPLWCWRDAVPLQHIGSRLFTDLLTQLAQLPLDFAIPPIRLLVQQTDHECLDLVSCPP